MKIAVIGGSGLIGSKLVARRRRQGHEAIAAWPGSTRFESWLTRQLRG